MENMLMIRFFFQESERVFNVLHYINDKRFGMRCRRCKHVISSSHVLHPRDTDHAGKSHSPCSILLNPSPKFRQFATNCAVNVRCTDFRILSACKPNGERLSELESLITLKREHKLIGLASAPKLFLCWRLSPRVMNALHCISFEMLYFLCKN